MVCSYTEYYSATHKNKALTDTTTLRPYVNWTKPDTKPTYRTVSLY